MDDQRTDTDPAPEDARQRFRSDGSEETRGVLTAAGTRHGDDDTLTTGEAARILGCSRQHVVDLCTRGLLPYSSVGTHRRVRRVDVELLRDHAERMSDDERRALWVAHAVAGRIVADPVRSISRARISLGDRRDRHTGDPLWLDEWDHLLRGSVEVMLGVLLDRSLHGRQLRRHHPFDELLAIDERTSLIDAWHRVADELRT